MKLIKLKFAFWGVISMLICLGLSDNSSIAQEDSINVTVIETSPVIFAAWNPQGDLLATLHEESSLISIWDTTTYELNKTIGREEAALIALDWSPDGQFVVALSSTQYMSIWDSNSGENMLTIDLPSEIELPEGYSTAITAIDWQPNGDRIAIGINYGVAIFNLSTGDISTFYDEDPNFGIVGVAWSPDGASLAVTSFSGDVAVLNPDDFQKFTRFANTEPVKNPNPYMLSKYIGPQSLNWNPNGNLIASIDYACFDDDLQFEGYALFIVDLSTEDTFPTSCGHEGLIYSVAWSPDGTRLATGSQDTTIRLWNAATFEVSDVLEGHTDIITTVAWNFDGNRLASGSLDGTIRIWVIE